MSYGDAFPGEIPGQLELPGIPAERMGDVSLFEHGRHRADTLMLAALHRIERKVDELMSALTDLQAADTALKDEVATFLTDIAGRLGTVSDAAAEQVVADIQAEVAALQAADTTPPPAPTPGG
jgi:DNA invertase Pin-like site-specific DNA recombinase